MTDTPFSLCVYCGARPGRNPAYLDAAQALGAAIGENRWRLVFGAGDSGIMGAVADAARASGAKAIGVIPTHLMGMESNTAHPDQIITENMHERKKVMFMNSDAVAVLPGGAGSMDEFFEVLTWAQLGLHAKPIVLVNIEGYWDPLLGLIDHLIGEGFADATLKDFFTPVATIPELVSRLRSAFTPR